MCTAHTGHFHLYMVFSPFFYIRNEFFFVFFVLISVDLTIIFTSFLRHSTRFRKKSSIHYMECSRCKIHLALLNDQEHTCFVSNQSLNKKHEWKIRFLTFLFFFFGFFLLLFLFVFFHTFISLIHNLFKCCFFNSNSKIKHQLSEMSC